MAKFRNPRPDFGGRNEFVRGARRLIMADHVAVLHALVCSSCALRANALRALILVEWTEGDFMEACFDLLIAGA